MQSENEVPETTLTAKQAASEIAKLVPDLDRLKAAEEAAKDDCDDDLVASIKAERIALLDSASDLFVAVMGEPLNSHSTGRRASLCRFAAQGYKVSEIRKYGDAVRIGTADGITLPAGKYANLSRGKSWCRLGTGSNAIWADNDNGHRVTVVGKWTVGSTDGFSRKEQTPWSVFVACGIYCAE